MSGRHMLGGRNDGARTPRKAKAAEIAHVSQSKAKHHLQDVVKALCSVDRKLPEHLMLPREEGCSEEAIPKVQNGDCVHVKEPDLFEDLLGQLDGALWILGHC